MLDKKKIVDLDVCVLDALTLFSAQALPSLEIPVGRRPLVVGSGNAAVVGRILFEHRDAVFADESTYLHKLDNIKAIDTAVLISASGGKHAPIIAQELKKRNLPVTLITNNPLGLADSLVNKTLLFPKNREPYTYNTSTYLGMVLAKTQEDPQKIMHYLSQTKKKIPKNLKKYDSYFIIVPEEFDAVREMFLTKFDELFGAQVSGRVFTAEQAMHAKTLVPSDKELFIGLGYNNRTFGKHRLNLPLPKQAGYGTLIALGYYVIGQIQKQHKPYYKKNIEVYTKSASRMFKEKIEPWVD